MKIGVPKETADGERRVALVPEVVRKLSGGLSGDAGSAVDVLVQRGAGEGALIPDAAFEDAGAQLVDDAAAALEAEVVVKVAAPTAEETAQLGPGLGADRLSRAADQRRGGQGDRPDRRDELRARGRAPDQPRAVDGRALVAGEHRRLPGGADRRSGAGALLPDADDRGGDDPPGDGARARRRGRGAAGDRDRAPAGRGRPGVRRPGGGQGAGRVTRREVPGVRSGRGPRGRGRLREGADGRAAGAPAGADGRGDRQGRRRDHDRARSRPPGADPGHRGGGQADEARVGDRRPGRRGRRQLRAVGARAERAPPRRQDPRAAERPEHDGRARLAAVRAQHPVAARADDLRRGRDRARLR